MAAEVLARAGVQVEVYDAMPSVGRKFLLAGKGGLNLTHSEAPDAFAGRYGDRRKVIFADIGLPHCGIDDRQDSLQVCPCGNLGHDALKMLMQFRLGSDTLTEHAPVVGYHGCRCFVASRLDRQ
jgi:hypothetical protein